MAVNTIELATVFQKALDTKATEKLTSGWMEGNLGNVIYNGGKEIKIPKLDMQGLGDYSRSEGYAPGTVSLEYETRTMTQDRGRQFMLDSMDVNESNFVANASNVMSTFQANYVVPEIDAYRYSKIASLLIEETKNNVVLATGGNAITKANILDLLDADIEAIQDVVGDIPLIITMSTPCRTFLNNAIDKKLDANTFTNGKINTKVSMYNNIPIIGVPSSRMKTKYTFRDGRTSGQEVGGFVAADDAKNINWLITPVKAPIAVSKTDKVRIFDPNVYQGADAWSLDYRKYHDLWITDEMLKVCRANIKEAL